jgi:diguanylate cyclase (GGDEF)-like protein
MDTHTARTPIRTRGPAVDELTGFGSRGKLIADLEQAVAPASRPSVLGIFDLAGLKEYQRVFGHPAADRLITRIAESLRHGIGRTGACYRPRQDEFCVLIDGPLGRANRIFAAAAEALREEGEAFLITSAFGVALLPEEASEPIAALAVADQRLRAVTQREPRERRRDPSRRRGAS